MNTNIESRAGNVKTKEKKEISSTTLWVGFGLFIGFLFLLNYCYNAFLR